MSTPQRSAGSALAAVALVAIATTAAATTASGSEEPPPLVVPAEFTEPTQRQVAASIQVWDPSGSVEPVEDQSTEGDEVVVRLSSDILFAFGSAELPPSAPEQIGEILADVPDGAAVEVTGHTDDIGSNSANQDLSERRAQAVATAIGATRPDLELTVAGRGESEPIAGNDDPEDRQLNRRVEIRFAS
jgi:outer membrane protein OmpA-like peptidoglycan-associated protein